MSEETPSAADHLAAREALEKNPRLAGDRFEAALAHLAKCHARFGSDSFRLRFGLREPNGTREALEADYFQGRLSRTEFRERLKRHMERPVDEELIDELMQSLMDRLEHYSRMRRAIAIQVPHSTHRLGETPGEVDIDGAVRSMLQEGGPCETQLNETLDFLSEARLQKGLGIAKAETFSAESAALLTLRVLFRAEEFWVEARRIANGSSMETTATRIFNDTFSSGLPTPQELLSQLEQELTLAKLVLRERQTQAQASASIIAQNVEMHVRAEKFSVSAIGGIGSACSQGEPKPDGRHVIAVSNWSELGIGIDEKGLYWAIHPGPSAGELFKKSQAVQLSIGSQQLKKVLEAFAEGATDSVSRDDLMRRLNILFPGQTGVRDSRAKPKAVESATVEGMSVRRTIAGKRFTTILADLRRKLGKVVEVPKNAAACLVVEDNVVRSVFRVRFLMRDASDRLMFGAPKR